MSGNLWSALGGSSFGKSYTLNFDGSHNNQANKSGAGCVIWDSQGEFVVAAAYNLTETYSEYCNVAIAEAVALRNGLTLAKDHNLNLNLIKGDSKEVIDHVLDRSNRPSKPPLSGIIQQIIGMINRFSQKLVIIDREGNQVADKLASWGTNKLEDGGRKFYMTYIDLPPQVAELMRKENPFSSREKRDDGEGSSLAENIGMAGAAIAGVAMLAWGVSKLMFGESSSDQQEQRNKAKAPQTWDLSTHNYASKRLEENEYYVLHYSGSDINQLQNGGAGCIIRKKQGKLVIAATYNLNHLCPDQYNVAIAEAVALINGLKLAKAKKIRLNRIIGDNEEVINRVRCRERKAPKIPLLDELIGEIQEGLHEQNIDPMFEVELIGREANKVANELASMGSKLGSRMETSYASEGVLPPKVAELIWKDVISWREI